MLPADLPTVEDHRLDPDDGPAPRTGVVIVAAGSGARVGADTNKVLLPLLGETVLTWSVRTVASLPYVDRLVVVVRREDAEQVAELVRAELGEEQEAVLVIGGATRHASEQRGLEPLRGPVAAGELEVVAVHDAARPLADAALFEAVVRAARRHGAALPVRPRPGVLPQSGGEPLPDLVAAQTPQAVRAGPLLAAYDRAEAEGFEGSDTATTAGRFADLTVVGVPAPATNLKITYAPDVSLAEHLLAGRASVPSSRQDGNE